VTNADGFETQFVGLCSFGSTKQCVLQSFSCIVQLCRCCCWWIIWFVTTHFCQCLLLVI